MEPKLDLDLEEEKIVGPLAMQRWTLALTILLIVLTCHFNVYWLCILNLQYIFIEMIF